MVDVLGHADEAVSPPDGRRARRARSRDAVIDAVFSLVKDSGVVPSVDQVAERAGVSVSSIFRIFDGLDDMRNQAVEQFGRRYAHLVEVEIDQAAPLDDRIRRFVRVRVELNREAGSLVLIARHRAVDHEQMTVVVGVQRRAFAAQVERCLATEIAQLTAADAANLCAQIDASTSPEAFDVLSSAHARTPRQIEQTWRRAVAALVTAWPAART